MAATIDSNANSNSDSTFAPSTSPPYAPSWLNLLINWIISLPGPSWLYYLLGLCIFALVVSGTAWLVGATRVGIDQIRLIAYSVYPVYFVALTHYLDGQALAALKKFRPALGGDEATYQRLAYELTTIPARGAWLATALALVPGVLVSVTDQSDPLVRSGTWLGIGVSAVASVFTVACVFVFAYHTVRQLRMVSRFHALASEVNPFHATPLYAFSEFTSRTGIGLILFAYYVMLLSGPDPYIALTYVIIAMLVMVAVAAFVLPLLGMHQRLAQEKNRIQGEVNRGLAIAHAELQERVNARNFKDMDDLDKALSGLLSLREVAAKLSTWPWQMETLRGFVSALLLPILIWILTTVLERYLAI